MKMSALVKTQLLEKLNAGEITPVEAIEVMQQLGIKVPVPGGSLASRNGKLRLIRRRPIRERAPSIKSLMHVPAGWGWREQE